MERRRKTAGYYKEEYGTPAPPNEIKRRAVNFALKLGAKAAIATVCYSPLGYLTVAIITRNGQMLGSPSLDALAMGMGAVQALYFLTKWAKRILPNGEQRGLGIYPDVIKQYENDLDANQGVWDEE